jgi:hypothetical protein
MCCPPDTSYTQHNWRSQYIHTTEHVWSLHTHNLLHVQSAWAYVMKSNRQPAQTERNRHTAASAEERNHNLASRCWWKTHAVVRCLCPTVRRHLRDLGSQPKHCMTTRNLIQWSTNRHQHPLRAPGTANRQPETYTAGGCLQRVHKHACLLLHCVR